MHLMSALGESRHRAALPKRRLVTQIRHWRIGGCQGTDDDSAFRERWRSGVLPVYFNEPHTSTRKAQAVENCGGGLVHVSRLRDFSSSARESPRMRDHVWQNAVAYFGGSRSLTIGTGEFPAMAEVPNSARQKPRRPPLTAAKWPPRLCFLLRRVRNQGSLG